MSAQPYPINLTSIFNKNSFEYDVTTSVGVTGNYITIEEGLNYYLAYPVSQGGEQINGILTSNDYININKTTSSTPTLTEGEQGTIIAYNYGSTNGYTNFINCPGLSGGSGGFEFLQYNGSTGTIATATLDNTGTLTIPNYFNCGSGIFCTNIDGGTSGDGNLYIGGQTNSLISIGTTEYATQNINIGTSTLNSGVITIGNISQTSYLNSANVHIPNYLYGGSMFCNAINSQTTLSSNTLSIGSLATTNTINLGMLSTGSQVLNIGSLTGVTGSINIGNSSRNVNMNSNLILGTTGSYIQFPDSTKQTTAYVGFTGSYLEYPISQGSETIDGNLTVENGNISLTTTGSYIQFPDSTQQTTAYVSSVSSYNLQSLSSSTNTWIFQLNSAANDLEYGSFFDYVIYTQVVSTQIYNFSFTSSQSTNTGTQSQIGYLSAYSAPNTTSSTGDNNYFYLYGTGIGCQCSFQATVSSSYTGTSQNYTFNNTLYSYYCDIINSNGNTITLQNYCEGYDITNTGTTAPTVNTYPTNYIRITAANNLAASSYLYMNISKRFTVTAGVVP